jgi:hypothetical protein
MPAAIPYLDLLGKQMQVKENDGALYESPGKNVRTE